MWGGALRGWYGEERMSKRIAGSVGGALRGWYGGERMGWRKGIGGSGGH